MRQKTGFGCRNPVDLVSKYIGTSYDVVKLVADNIDILESISINIDGILEIGDNIDDISIVANNIEEVVLVGQNIDNLEEVILHIDDISLINDNITDVVTVADNIDHIIFLAESISNPTLIDRVDDLESRVDILEDTSSTHTNQINLQSGYIQDLQTNVSSNSIDIDSLDTRVTEVETLSQNTSDTLVNHIVDYNANKSSVDAKFIEVENDIQANADAIAAWEEYDDTALSGRVTILEDDLDSLTIEVANNKDAIDNFENYDDAELRGRVETNELDITNLEDVVNNLDGLSPTDRAKFDGIEDGATADQTDSEIKEAYEKNNNTNAFTDAEKLKLEGLNSGIGEAPVDNAQYARQNGEWTIVESSGGSVAPVGDIIITHEEAFKPGYDKLNVPFVSDVIADPILHSEYYTRGGNYIKTETNNAGLQNPVLRIHEYPTKEEGSVYITQRSDYMLRIFRDYENRTDEAIINFNPADFGGNVTELNLAYLSSIHNEMLIFRHVSYDRMYIIKLDYSLATTQEMVDAVDIQTIDAIEEFGLGLYTIRPTGSGLLCWMDPWNTYQAKRIPWDLDLSNIEDIDLSGISRMSDGPGEKEFLFNNDYVLSRGVIYDYDGNGVATINSYDHTTRKSHLYCKGIDYVQNYTNTTSKNIYIGYPDGSHEIKPFSSNSNNTTTRTVVMYEDEDNFMTYESYSSYMYLTSINKDGVLTDIPNDDVLKTTATLSKIALYQFNRPELLVQDDNNKNINYKYEYLTDIPDAFTIPALDTGTAGMIYQIKTESAMARDGVE